MQKMQTLSVPFNTSNTVYGKSYLPHRGKTTSGLDDSGMRFRVVLRGKSLHPPEWLPMGKVNMECVIEEGSSKHL